MIKLDRGLKSFEFFLGSRSVQGNTLEYVRISELSFFTRMTAVCLWGATIFHEVKGGTTIFLHLRSNFPLTSYQFFYVEGCNSLALKGKTRILFVLSEGGPNFFFASVRGWPFFYLFAWIMHIWLGIVSTEECKLQNELRVALMIMKCHCSRHSTYVTS